MKANTIILSLALVISAGLHAWGLRPERKVAYIRSRDVVYGYFGMKEAMGSLEEVRRLKQYRLDSLRNVFEQEVSRAADESTRNSPLERTLNDQRIAAKHGLLKRQEQEHANSIATEEAALLKGVLAQVNTHARTFAEMNGYQIVLGTTDAGSLMYGEEGLDVTDELIGFMNEAQTGQR